MKYRALAIMGSSGAAPAWATSAIFHASVLVALSIVWVKTPPQAQLGSRVGQSRLTALVAAPATSDLAEQTELDLPVPVRLHDASLPDPQPVPTEEEFLDLPVNPESVVVMQLASTPPLPREDQPSKSTPQQTQTHSPEQPAPVAETSVPSTSNPAPIGNELQTPPRFDHNAPIVYPPEAVDAHIEGTVWLRLRIATDGCVQEVKVVRSSGHVVLDRQAVETVNTWRGEPARIGDRPIETIEILPVVFRFR